MTDAELEQMARGLCSLIGYHHDESAASCHDAILAALAKSARKTIALREQQQRIEVLERALRELLEEVGEECDYVDCDCHFARARAALSTTETTPPSEEQKNA